MISENDAHRTYKFEDHYVIAPSVFVGSSREAVSAGVLMHDGFSYRSDTNDWFLGIDEIKSLLSSIA